MTAGRRTRREVLLTLPLAVVGLAVSAYLTYEHYSASTTLACPDTGGVDCVKVTSSSWSELFGAPVALLGVVYFALVVALCLPVAWRARSPWVSRVRLLALAGGVAMVLYLVWAELFRIDAICLWCTVVHVVTVFLFGIVAVIAALAVPADDSVLTR